MWEQHVRYLPIETILAKLTFSILPRKHCIFAIGLVRGLRWTCSTFRLRVNWIRYVPRNQWKTWTTFAKKFLAAELGTIKNVLWVLYFKVSLKVVSATFVLVYFLRWNESTCQTRKNVFYFTLKALFVLKKIKF